MGLTRTLPGPLGGQKAPTMKTFHIEYECDSYAYRIRKALPEDRALARALASRSGVGEPYQGMALSGIQEHCDRGEGDYYAQHATLGRVIITIPGLDIGVRTLHRLARHIATHHKGGVS